MDKLARELPEYDVISEIPGCGKKLTSRVIAEIGDVRRFKNAGSIIAYAGLNKFLRMYYGTVKKKYRELNIW